MEVRLVAEKFKHYKVVNNLGGILNYEDMSNYKSTWDSTVSVHLNSVNLTVHSVPPPGSGVYISNLTVHSVPPPGSGVYISNLTVQCTPSLIRCVH